MGLNPCATVQLCIPGSGNKESAPGEANNIGVEVPCKVPRLSLRPGVKRHSRQSSHAQSARSIADAVRHVSVLSRRHTRKIPD